jgi:predicted nucleic acid-binding protein
MKVVSNSSVLIGLAIAVLSLLEHLHGGEAEAIILAKESSADLILLDDPKARATASHMGIEKIGTIGILQLALKQGILKDIKEDYEKIFGFCWNLNFGVRISRGKVDCRA